MADAAAASNQTPRREVLSPLKSVSTPLIICFHGSGDTCASWQDLAELLAQSYCVLLFDRSEQSPRPKESVAEMAQYLDDAGLQPPYVLVAHSYGGTFAREFLQAYPDRVAGMVLAETGQETALDPAVEAAQYRQTILGSKPLSVIRGNTMLAKRALLDSRLKACKNEAQRRNLRESPDFKLLVAYEKEDEDLKKRQLKLSRNHRYVRVHDCGHDVIEDRPEIVWEEVQWVMAQITGPTFAANAPPIDPSRGSSVAITIRSSASRILNRFRLQ